MISKQDILDYINNNYSSVIGNIHIYENEIINELINLCNDVNEAQNKNDNQLISEKYLINSIVKEFINNNLKYNERRDKLYKLLELKLPEQRSPEWYEMRRDKLTASSIATAMGDDNYKSKYNLIYDKITNAPHISNIHTEWGTKYEEIATLFYQLITKTTVKEFGMIPHPDFPIFGASPDGICDDTGPIEYTGRMLEIKCPTRREFWVKGNKSKWMPHHYWMQMQGQLEVCDLDECDFLQVKLEEYNTFIDYKNDILNLEKPLSHSYPNVEKYDTIITGKTSENLPKGCTISYKKEGDDNLSYLYPKLLLSDDEYLQWIDEYIKKGYNIVETKWWKITRYEIDLVKRDKIWWNDHIQKIMSFYDDFVYYRDNLSELEEKVKKNTKEIFIPNVPLPDFVLCDSDDDNDDTSKKNNIEKVIINTTYNNKDLPEFAL